VDRARPRLLGARARGAAATIETLPPARTLDVALVDASRAHATVDAEWQERVLNDGSRWQVFKRHFTPEGLAAEVGGGDTLHVGHAFVVVRSVL
jgi:hypothetical protein